jgi:threonylcarbamoyladenosine tRNA methylthiotransferase MtaB
MSGQEPQVLTFGCRLNAYESEVIKDHAQKNGLTDAIIFNTCAVTAEAERQVRQAIRRARRDHPNKKIIVTGCAAQINPDFYNKMGEVDQVIGNNEKMKPETFSPLNTERLIVNDIMSVRETAEHLISGFDGKTRAFAQVQNGCDHRCTFCTIPFGRGNSRSVPIGVIVEQIREFLKQGYKEVVLTGVDITSYGHDLPGTPSLGQMMRRLLAQVPELPRLRLSSVDPVEIDEDVFRLLEEEPRFMPHLHISLQAGDNMILKRMKRRHLREDVISFCEKARRARKDVTFGADIIAGFPTETEDMFQNSLQIIEECGLTYIHVFPYSPRPGTPAARMPQVAKQTVKDRARRLREAGDHALSKFLQSLVGHSYEILVEHGSIGRTPHFAPIQVPAHLIPGTRISMKMTNTDNKILQGTVVS